MEVNSLSCGSSFACNGQYFALISIDNRLRIWETTSGKLVQEFSPSADIESSCTCLCWTREHTSGFDGSIFHGRNKDAKKRKRKLKDENTNNFPSIILGTKGGKLLLYSPMAGEAQGIYIANLEKKLDRVLKFETQQITHSKLILTGEL